MIDRVHPQVGPFGKVVAQKAIGVLIASSLQRGVRVAEINLYTKGFRYVDVSSHLGSLVPGDGPEHRWWQVLHPCAERLVPRLTLPARKM